MANNSHQVSEEEIGILIKENLSLYRELAAVKMNAKNNGVRLDAKNRECAQLREQIAKLNEQLESRK